MSEVYGWELFSTIGGKYMRFKTALAGALLSLSMASISVVAAAQEKTGVKEGFVLKPGTARIIVMRPNIRVGEQSTGGMFEPNADWTAQGRENIQRELALIQRKLGNEVIPYEESVTNENSLASQYSNLFGSVAESAIEYQFFKGNRLPTKVKSKGLDWSLGPDVAKLPSVQGADYMLFLNTFDSLGSTGRKALQIVGMLAGVGVTAGQHKGYAGLVDLHTGELVWLNVDMAMGGDVRTQEGPAKRVSQLLEGFPGRPEGR